MSITNNIKMLYYDWIGVSEDTDVDKTSASKSAIFATIGFFG